MALNTARDIPLLIISSNASAERRITPSWTLAQLKAKLESVTGIPPSSQILTLRLPGKEIALQAQDEDITKVSKFPLQAYAEIHVSSPILLVYAPVRGIYDHLAYLGSQPTILSLSAPYSLSYDVRTMSKS